MRFGLFGAAQAQRGGPDVDSAAGFRDYIDYVIETEALGFHASFIVEHHFTGFGQVSASLNLLTWIGARTSTIRLGTAVLVLPWHNPVLLAEQAATLDLLSGGRLDFGIGKGYRHNEFVGFCIPMDEAEARFALYGSPDEIARKLEVLRGMGVEYVLLNGGGTSRENLRRFAREVMPAFIDPAEHAGACVAPHT